MNKIELTDNELENILELVISNNQYNDDNDTIDFWNSIIGKLDPDRKFSGVFNYWTCVICDNKTEEGNRCPTDDKGNYSQEEGHFWTCETCFEKTEHLLDAEEEKNQLIEDKKRKGQLNWGSIVYGGEDGAY